MKAKKMFEKLKLKDSTYDEMEDYIQYYWIEMWGDGTEREQQITFWLEDKTISFFEYKVDEQDNSECGMEFSVDMEILKIINKQVKELGWYK